MRSEAEGMRSRLPTPGSGPADPRPTAVHLVSAWADEARLVLGQRRVDDRANASTALSALLKTLALDGCIVTIDAMGCPKRIAQTLSDRRTDYVLALLDNHQITTTPSLAKNVMEPYANQKLQLSRSTSG